MPRAIGWAPALLPSRGSVIASPRFNPGTQILRFCALRLEIEEAALLPIAPTLPSGKLDRPVKYRFFRRSNFLAIRHDRHLEKPGVAALCRDRRACAGVPQSADRGLVAVSVDRRDLVAYRYDRTSSCLSTDQRTRPSCPPGGEWDRRCQVPEALRSIRSAKPQRQRRYRCSTRFWQGRPGRRQV
jgi:hypothetical protein